MAAAHPLPPAEGSPPPLEELCSPLTRIPRPSAFPPPPSSYKRLSRSNSRRRSSVSSSEGESMLASPAAYLPLRSRTLSIGSQGRAEDDDDEVSCCLSVNSSVAVSGCASTSSLLGDSSGRKRGGGRRRSDAGVDKENLKAQANECMDLRKQLAVEQERRGKAESMVRQLKGQLREYKGKRMSDDEKDKRIDRLLRRLSLVAAELEESRKQARDAEGVHEKAMLELAAVKQGAAKERSQQAQALADLRHASTKRIAELTAECEKLEEAVAEGEGRKADVDKHRDRMVAMEIVIENLTREGKEQTTEKELLQKQVGELKEKLAALEEVKGREIDELKSVEARRTREMLDRIRAVEQELEASQGLHKKYENEVKAAREEAEGVKEEMSQVTSELAAVRRRMEVEERSKLAAEERYEKLKVAEARRLGEVSALKLELVEVREALRASEAKAESLARELEEEGDEAVPPIELLIEDQEGGEALITEEATVTQPSPLPRSVIESPGVVSLYSTPGGLANSSVKRRRRLRRVSALLLDAAVTLQHSGAMGELKDQVFNITAQLVESIAQQRCAQEERDSACVRLADVQMQLAEERERMEELKAEVNTKARESMISSGRAAVAEGMLRELAEDRQREKLSLLAEIASLRSTLLENEATAAQSAASARVGMQEARERIRVLETRLGMQDNSFAAMVEQCTKWKAQNEHLQSQVSARELELDSVRASLREWKGRAAELSDDLVRAGDSLVNTEASMLDLQFKVSFYETLYTQKEASVIVARACVVGLSRAAMVAAEEEKAREAALRAAEILSSRAEVARTKEEAAAHLAATLEYMQHEKEELEALIRETQEETYQLRNGIEELDKERESMGEELRITRERMAEREAEVEVLRATGLSAEQRQCLEGEIEGANKTLREALGDLASTRADLETAAKEVARCHKIMERFDMEAITSGTASNANSGGNRLSQSRRVSYVQHLRHEINNLYEENKRLRNERQALEAQLLMGTRRSPAGQNTPSPGGSNSFTPRRTPRKGPVPPRTPKTPMGMAAAELARRKREAEEMKINERHRQRLVSERLIILGRVRDALNNSTASPESLRALLESIRDILVSKDTR